MNSSSKPPLVLANRVIRQFADHLLGPTIIILPQDYTALRTVFRKCGGTWEKILEGDIVHLNLMTKIVVSWGAMPDRKKSTEFG